MAIKFEGLNPKFKSILYLKLGPNPILVWKYIHQSTEHIQYSYTLTFARNLVAITHVTCQRVNAARIIWRQWTERYTFWAETTDRARRCVNNNRATYSPNLVDAMYDFIQHQYLTALTFARNLVAITHVTCQRENDARIIWRQWTERYTFSAETTDWARRWVNDSQSYT